MSLCPRRRVPAPVALLLVAPLLVATSATSASAAPTASPAAPEGAARPSASTLRVSPKEYVGGQRILFAGDLGVAGKRRVKLQLNLSRPGDEWKDVNGFRKRWTRSDGSFRFRYTAPAMFGIQMRVASGKHRTSPIEFHARSQDLVIAIESGRSGLDADEVQAGSPFDLVVDTTPEGGSDLARRTDLPPPAFPGRELTLQRRAGDGTWNTVQTPEVTTDARGIGVFSDLTLPASPSQVVFRVTQEKWTAKKSRIGWYPSFPTYVNVVSQQRTAAGASARPADTAPTALAGLAVATAQTAGEGEPLSVGRDVASKTAAERYQWRPSLWDFGWTYGESLTDRPSRGSDRVGWWQDWADGTGRAAKHNGGLMLDSQRQNKDDLGSSVGTTMATLQDNPMRYGRWEVRLRMKSTETSHRDLLAHIELVPEGTAPRCHAEGITIASASPHSRGVEIGVRNQAGKSWSRTEPGISVNGTSHAVAVEVTKKHISWFLEGRLIGTVTDRAAIPDGPMTLRVSLQGKDQDRVNRTQAIFDWMRGYALDRGRKVGGGPSLSQGTHSHYC